MKVTIMYRSNYDGGDGWTYFPMDVHISHLCPKCGQERGKTYPYRFCEDGEWFTVDRWDNPCGHLDTYGEAYHEAKRLKPTSSPQENNL